MKWEQSITKLKRKPLSVLKTVLATTSVPVLFVDAKGRQCRYPLWDDATPAEKRMVCGAPATEGRLGVSDIAKRYSRMTPDQIAEAQRMARERIAKH